MPDSNENVKSAEPAPAHVPPGRSSSELLAGVCFACGRVGARHVIRELSPRSGYSLCEDCKTAEDHRDNAMRWLCG